MTTKRIVPFLICVATIASLTAVNAGESEFVEIAENTHIRLISSMQNSSDGTVLAGIELKMPQLTKTYWKVPGETGIPMSLDWSSSEGLEDLRIDWPLPERDSSSAYVDHVYHGDMIFPVHLTLQDQQNAVWHASIRMGICDEICVPVSVDLTLAIDTRQQSRATGLQIRQAIANVPLSLEATDLLASAPRFNLETAELEFELTGLDLDMKSLIVFTQDRSLIFGAPEQVGPRRFSVQLLSHDVTRLTDQSMVQFVFDTPMGPYVAQSQFEIAHQLTQ